jgi:hypothetical protein
VQEVRITSGATVTFTLHDVVCPDLTPVFEHVGPELLVTGQVSYLSDCGEQRDHFVIVDVNGMHTPLIVPVARLNRTPVNNEDPDIRERVKRRLTPA